MNQLTRGVHIFPRFTNNYLLEAIRKKYDNLYGCIEPHITLVFPFESELNGEIIKKEIEKLVEDEDQILITAKQIEAVENHGYYLFLNIEDGLESLKKLHYKLHCGILSEYQSPWTKEGTFVPHITVGRFDNQEELEKAYEEIKDTKFEFQTVVDKLYVEIIGENEESNIEHIIKFGKRVSKS